MSTETRVGRWQSVQVEPDVYVASRRTVIVEDDDEKFTDALDAMDRADELNAEAKA